VDTPQKFNEEIVVPAGKFKTVRVEVTGALPAFSLNTNDSPARFQYTAWYAPEIKRYVMVRHQTRSRFGAIVSDEVVQLVEYRPAPAEAPPVAATARETGDK
jgi:hypothetical protein